MDKPLWRRRQLLYAGLGLAGTGTTLCLGLSSCQQIGSEQLTSVAASGGATGDKADSSALVPVGQPIPDFQGISQWLNSTPLAISELKGRVVLVQFWTFACINCQRTLPYLVDWHQRYADRGLTVIGVHTPEFAYERDVNNISRAIAQHQISYAVPVDNDYQTWNAYRNQYWPHLFLADREGYLRYDHIGEGAYDTTEQTILTLLG